MVHVPSLRRLITYALMSGAVASVTFLSAQTPAPPAKPVFVDGQAQIVPAFEDQSQWVRQTLWVETEFDSDKDGKRDRVFTDVTHKHRAVLARGLLLQEERRIAEPNGT